MVEEPAPQRVVVAFNIPYYCRDIPGFVEFVGHVAEGRVDKAREMLNADVALAKKYLYGVVLFAKQNHFVPRLGRPLHIAVFRGDDAMFGLLLNAMGETFELEAHPIHLAIDLCRTDYLSSVLAIAARHPEMRWALLGDANREEAVVRENEIAVYIVGMNGLDKAVQFGAHEQVALILEFLETHPELTDLFIPDRRHLPNLETPLKVAAVAFNRLMVELLLGSRFADRFYVNPELVVNAWMHLPRSREREARRLLMAQVIIYFKPEFAAVHAHEYFVENAFLNCDVEELRQQVRSGHHASPVTIRNILSKLKEFYGADVELFRRIIVLYTDFMNQLLDLQREVQTELFWGGIVKLSRVQAAQETIGSLMSYLRDWVIELDRGFMHQLVGLVFAAIVFRGCGLPWKQRR